MFESIYRKLIKDFIFLNDYNFYFLYTIQHYIHPGVVFSKEKEHIYIYYSYETNKLSVQFSNENIPQVQQDILKDTFIPKTSYNKQVQFVTQIVKDYLSLNFKG